MLTGKTTVLVSDKAAADLHNVLIEASEWIQVMKKLLYNGWKQ